MQRHVAAGAMPDRALGAVGGEVVVVRSDAVLAQQRPVSAPAPTTPELAKPQLPEMEPSFAPGGEGVDVTIGAVPGFQGLMEVQRALVRLPQVQSAAVRR